MATKPESDPGSELLTADTALAVYGTLRPGEVNHFVVKDIPGHWVDGAVRGYVYEISWGPAEGYPGLSLHDDGHLVPVALLISPVLAENLWRVDRFEGDGYDRRSTKVLTPDGGEVLGWASIYEAKTDVE